MCPLCDSQKLKVGISRSGGKLEFFVGDVCCCTHGGVSKSLVKSRHVEFTTVIASARAIYLPPVSGTFPPEWGADRLSGKTKTWEGTRCHFAAIAGYDLPLTNSMLVQWTVCCGGNRYTLVGATSRQGLPDLAQ